MPAQVIQAMMMKAENQGSRAEQLFKDNSQLQGHCKVGVSSYLGDEGALVGRLTATLNGQNRRNHYKRA